MAIKSPENSRNYRLVTPQYFSHCTVVWRLVTSFGFAIPFFLNSNSLHGYCILFWLTKMANYFGWSFFSLGFLFPFRECVCKCVVLFHAYIELSFIKNRTFSYCMVFVLFFFKCGKYFVYCMVVLILTECFKRKYGG